MQKLYRHQMNIGFDAKRIFQNKTGLGNYSRSLVTSLAEFFPEHQYNLYAPKQTNLFNAQSLKNVEVKTPLGFWNKKFRSFWRRRTVVKNLVADSVQLYHGLSNELPTGLKKTGIKSVVTVHDLIFERYPETYNFDERYTHRWKVKHACGEADSIIAISEQTKRDLHEYYKVPLEKIAVCYQTCGLSFQRIVSDEEKSIIKRKYDLPDRYFLFVSSITQRKNLITVCKALLLLKNNPGISLLVIGDGKKEKEDVKSFLKSNGIEDRVIFLNETDAGKTQDFISAKDFPAIYQQAAAMIYPSIFEGFGLPVLEAMYGKVPVVCSNTSSIPEVGGDAVLYFSPKDEKQLAEQLLRIINDNDLVILLKEKGLLQAQKFSEQKHASAVMRIYESLL